MLCHQTGWVLTALLLIDDFRVQVLLCSNIDRICPMARVGFRPLGQTATQFMIPRQRNTLNGSSSLDKRSVVAVSRLSARKRYACSKPAGPMNLSGFHQNEGQLVLQQAHRMHPYGPSSLAGSSGDCNLSIAGAVVSFCR